MLEIKNLTKYYGKVKGIEDINLKINKGEIFGFIGPNGAGKSTTIKCIMNLINKTSGQIYINGKLDTKEETELKENIGYLPGEIYLYDDMKVKDILKYSANFYKKDCSKRTKYLVSKLELDINKKIEELSLGNLKKVGIVLSMMHEPELLIFDEATSGLDPLMQEVFYELLLEEKQKGTTIFFSSHILNEIKRICDRVGIIKNGSLIEVQDVKELLDSNFQIITIRSNNIDEILNNINNEFISRDENTAKFMYKENINDLIKFIENYEIEKLLIEEPEIEEIFMHYYK